MNIPHTKFCVLPWISLEASPIGTVRPCCLADDEICDSTGQKFRLGQATFDDIRNSEHMRDLRQSFLLDQQPATCRRCWAVEDSGGKSKRQYTLERLNHVVDQQTWTVEPSDLMFVDLKLGNICNLKCRICGSWSSSQFAVEEITHSKQRDRDSFHNVMLRDGRWPRDNPAFWQQMTDHMGELRYLEFTGGEPFMIQEHFDLLKDLVKHGYADQIEIHYNTNGTQYPEMAPEIWRHFRHVEIAFSIDDLGDRFEYQRTNAVWSEVVANIDRFRKLRSESPNISLQVCSTVNIFNVFSLPELARWNREQDFNFVYWNMLHDAPEWSIAHLPQSAKDTAAELLLTAEVEVRDHAEFQRIVRFMQQGQSWDGSELKRKIDQLDQRRQQSVATVLPELAQALGYASTNS
jgi:MoaA/NifB/PqqE/SkfB family radical SAM enzyme